MLQLLLHQRNPRHIIEEEKRRNDEKNAELKAVFI
jgi:hypothetical protein